MRERLNWEKHKVGTILKLEYGKPLPDEKRISDGNFPVYGANGLKGKSNEYYCDKKSIVVGRKGSAGEINLTEDKFWPLDVTYFVTFDEKKYNLFFLFYLLSTLDLPNLAKGIKPGLLFYKYQPPQEIETIYNTIKELQIHENVLIRELFKE